MTFVPGCVKVVWEQILDDDDPDAIGELGSGNYCADHFPKVLVQKAQEGYAVDYKWHDSDWGQGCEVCADSDSS